MTPTGPFLALDTATRTATVAIGDAGTMVGSRTWSSGHHASDSLLAAIEAVLAETVTPVSAVRGVIAGIGPGSFTGLRVGLATAKVIAYALRVPIVGVPTARALALAAGADGAPVAVVLPAGPTDRYLTLLASEHDERRVDAGADGDGVAATRVLTPAGVADELPPGARVIAVDVPAADASVTDEDRALGERAVQGLGSALLLLGGAALRAGRSQPVEELVPAYAQLPRGITEVTGSIRWSSDHR